MSRSRLPRFSIPPVRDSLLPGFLIALCSLLLGALWAFRIAPLNAPDEIAHLQVIMRVREGHLLPEAHYDFTNGSGPRATPIGSSGDALVREYARHLGFTDTYQLIPYEAMQPPLYYLAAGLLARAVPPDPATVLYLSRLLSVFFAVATVFFCWAAVRQLAPTAPLLAVVVAGTIALLPQFCFNGATAANDSALNLFAAVSFYLWFRSLRDPRYDPWMFRSGLVLGLAVLTKLSALALAPALIVVIVFRAFQVRVSNGSPLWEARLNRAAWMSTGAFVAFVLACGWWVLRNLLVYGEPSGSRDTFRFYMGRFLFLDLSSPSSINYFVDASLQSSLGRFGWMTSPLPPAYYLQATVIGTLLLTLTTLFLVAIITRRSARSTVPRYIWQSVVTGLIAALVTITSYVLFSVQVAFQPQGRYLFLILVPTTLALTTGLYFLPVRPLVRVAAFSVLFIWLGFANHVGLLVAAFVSPT